MKGFLKKATIAVFANIVSLLVSTIVVFLVPKSISVAEYGFFQLYIFYSGYIGFLNFGWPEGIMLRYGGKKYNELDKNGLKTEVLLFSLMTSIVGSILVLIALFQNDANMTNVIIGVGLCIIIYLPRVFMQTIIHMTGRVNEYSKSIIIEKTLYLLIVVLLLLLKVKDFKYYVMADLIGRLIALTYIAYESRDIIKSKSVPINKQIKEIKTNISVGIKLMLANLAGLFIIGIVRQCIKSNWDIETFAKISLILSISNMLIVCIRAVAVVLFPYLKRIDKGLLNKIYKSIRICLIVPLFAMLIFYYPIKEIMVRWLPNYIDSLNYMFLLFPICIYEAKTSLLIETFMKTLRLEKKMLMVNIITVVLSFTMSYIFVFVLNNLILSVFSILMLVAIRCILSEIFLSKSINIKLTKDIIIELIMVLMFIILNWKIGGIIGFVLYILLFCIFVICNNKDIRQSLMNLKGLKVD